MKNEEKILSTIAITLFEKTEELRYMQYSFQSIPCPTNAKDGVVIVKLLRSVYVK